MSVDSGENKVRVPVFFAKPHHQAYESVLPKLKKEAGILLIESGSIVELVPRVKKIGFGVVVLHTPNQDQLVKAITFLRLNQDALIKGFLKVIVCCPFQQRSVLSTLEKYGTADIISPPFNWRTVDLKVKRWIGTLESRLDLSKEKAGKGRRRGRQSSQNSSMDRKEGTVQMVNALDHPSDVWVIERKRPRKMMGRWAAHVVGPPPNQGRWISNDNDLRATEKWWQWVPNLGDDDPYIEKGSAWLLWGQRPEFRDDSWQFVGQKIHLVLKKGDQEIGRKIATNSKGDLVVARDSKLATSRVPIFLKLLRELVRTGKSTQAQVQDRARPTQEDGGHDADEVFETAGTESADLELSNSKKRIDYETSEWNGHPIQVGQDEEGIPIFVIPSHVFSKKPGVWESAGALTPSETGFLFVDEDGKREQGYFLFSGRVPPRRSEAEDAWIFIGREPEWVESESELPRFFKQYLEKRGDGPPEMPKPVEDSGVNVDEFGEDGGSIDPDLIDSAEASSPNDPYAHSDFELTEAEEKLFRQITDEGHVYEGEIRGEEEAQHPGDVLEISADQTPYREHDSPDEPLDPVLDSEIGQVAEEQVMHALEREEMRDITKVLTHGASKEAARKLRSEDPSEPSLSVLAMGYLVSELMIKRSLHPSALITRYMEFLKNACGGLEVEIWAKRGKSFARIGSSARTTLDSKTVMPLLGELSDAPYRVYQNAAGAAVRRGEVVIGAVILYGDGSDRVPQDYLVQNARFCVGFCTTEEAAA